MSIRRNSSLMILSLALLLAVTHSLHAEETADPDQLQALQQAIDNLAEQEKTLTSSQSEASSALSEQQKAMVLLARETQKNERNLNAIEQKLATLQQKRTETTQHLGSRRKEVSHLLTAMSRLTLIPEEAWLARPGSLPDAIRTASALSAVTGSLRREAAQLGDSLEQLAMLESESQSLQQHMREAVEQLNAKRDELQSKIADHQKQVASLQGELTGKRRQMQQLADQARSLQQLLQEMETRREAQQKMLANIRPAPKPRLEAETPAANLPPATTPPPATTQAAAPIAPVESASLQSPDRAAPSQARAAAAGTSDFARAKGNFSLPASGKIIGAYGSRRSSDALTRGLHIQTRDKAAVVAPFKGEVVYTGPFLSYGNIVIVRHDGDHHSLIAGLQRINVTLGQFVLQGEPIGQMGSTADGLTKLYVELRTKSRPVDPLPWMNPQQVKANS